MKGITQRMVARKFELWAKTFDFPVMKWEGGKCAIGSVHLDHYHGYHVEQMTSEHGAVRVLNDWRMNRTEMLAWFEGCMWALDDERMGTYRK